MTPAQAVEHGRAHLRFCEAHWFGQPGTRELAGQAAPARVPGRTRLPPACGGRRPSRGLQGRAGDPALRCTSASPRPSAASPGPRCGDRRTACSTPRTSTTTSTSLRSARARRSPAAWPSFHDFWEAGTAPLLRPPRRPRRRDVPHDPGAGDGVGELLYSDRDLERLRRGDEHRAGAGLWLPLSGDDPGRPPRGCWRALPVSL